jgi:tRNA pseudouridine65 synthase
MQFTHNLRPLEKTMKFPVLFEDDTLLAIHKPSGIHVHPSEFSRGEESVLDVLQAEFPGKWFAPVHRIDRATSGIVLYAKNPDAARALGEQFIRREVHKKYWCVVRGYLGESQIVTSGSIENDDYAETHYTSLAEVELPHSMGKHPTSRYSLLEARPVTGRRHQIRRHCSHISHPIIGDVRYGDGRHNALWRKEFGLNRLLLFALEISFSHPTTNEVILLTTRIEREVEEVFGRFGWAGGLD